MLHFRLHLSMSNHISKVLHLALCDLTLVRIDSETSRFDQLQNVSQVSHMLLLGLAKYHYII